ncbi:MAG: two-component system, cell cycle sensor histidine kinase and response regulator CckA [Gaiellaceae bacterium]|jgi:DNA-binding response OmpR family regulator|nr:two-component system, cell cycle sensor histidine kinase and response regulator CckA [Gaiellaceae bacterium]
MLEPQTGADAGGVTASARILVVEDDPAVGLFVASVLTRAGYEVCRASGLLEARVLAADRPLDLLLTDVVLGSVDGLDVEEAVRALQPHVKSLFMSGYAKPRYRVGSEDPVLAKPFEAAELIERVEAILGSRHRLPA